jgi:hypothetical protein
VPYSTSNQCESFWPPSALDVPAFCVLFAWPLLLVARHTSMCMRPACRPACGLRCRTEGAKPIPTPRREKPCVSMSAGQRATEARQRARSSNSSEQAERKREKRAAGTRWAVLARFYTRLCPKTAHSGPQSFLPCWIYYAYPPTQAAHLSFFPILPSSIFNTQHLIRDYQRPQLPGRRRNREGNVDVAKVVVANVVAKTSSSAVASDNLRYCAMLAALLTVLHGFSFLLV